MVQAALVDICVGLGESWRVGCGIKAWEAGLAPSLVSVCISLAPLYRRRAGTRADLSLWLQRPVDLQLVSVD